MTNSHTCCCYVLTPPGTGAIGLIRVQGHTALDITAKIFRSKCGRPLNEALFAGNRLRYGWIIEQGERIDDVLVSRPDTAGEEAVDISAHGGVRIIERILAVLEAAGAVVSCSGPRASDVWPAINLIEAEALDAMVEAKTERAIQFLGWQRQHLADHLHRVAVSIESNPGQAKNRLSDMLAAFKPARTLISGATVALVGPPNSGKSTLFNALLGRDGAIVSAIAGTTRDWVAGDVEMQGVPIELIDTAGLRDASESLERSAMAAGRVQAAKADVTVVLLDATESVSLCSSLIDPFVAGSRNTIVVLNKLDLLGLCEADVRRSYAGSYEGTVITLSALKLVGLEAFVERLVDRLGLVNFEVDKPVFFTKRQVELARKAQDLLGQPDVAARFVDDVLIGST